ncbi:hypothetical protein BGZ65_007187 [Modicella reniformis]|uniref:Uncharacterized protein n=1 Tax=Modicella reniformis TaxID=1440133 RepID=A0A9P6IVF9_9FUNG|nr:hypothetical protein BGZ65_007187 [Modicella reniformis]
MGWAWDRQAMNEFVETLKGSRIQVLFLKCMVDAADAEDRPVPDSSGIKASRTRRFDPLVKLLGLANVKEIRLLETPDIVHESTQSLPFDLSHLRTLQLRLEGMDQVKDEVGDRVIQLLERTTHLRELTLDCKPHAYGNSLTTFVKPIAEGARKYFDHSRSRRQPCSEQNEYRRQMQETRDPQERPPECVEIKYNHKDKLVLVVKVERSMGLIREFSLDLAGEMEYGYWTSIFQPNSDLSSNLTTLRLTNLRDNVWVEQLRDWIQAMNRMGHVGRHRLWLQELLIDCKELGTEFQKFYDFIFGARSTLLLAKFVNFYPKLKEAGPDKVRNVEEEMEEGEERSTLRDRRAKTEWGRFFRSLNFGLLKELEIERANLRDEDIKSLMDSLSYAKWKYGSLTLRKLCLFNTQVTKQGVGELIRTMKRSSWNINVEYR